MPASFVIAWWRPTQCGFGVQTPPGARTDDCFVAICSEEKRGVLHYAMTGWRFTGITSRTRLENGRW